MKKTAFLLLIFVLGYQLHSQAQLSQDLAKNTLFASVGFIGLGGSIHGNYERVFFQGCENSFIHTLSVRLGAGAGAVWGSSGPLAILGVPALIGKQNHHFEAVAGLVTYFDKESYDIGVNNAEFLGEPIPPRTEYIDLLLAASAGYRFQKPRGGFMFRAGIGFREGVYIGLGAAF